MTDVQGRGQFLERGLGMSFDVGQKFLGLERAPFPPARFGGERAGLGGGQIAIHRAPRHPKAAGRLDLGTALLQKLHHPFPQIQRIGFHAQSLSPYVPM